MKTKNVIFEYYRIYARIYNKENGNVSERKKFNLKPVIEKAYSASAKQRVFQVYGEEANLQLIEQDNKDSDMWKMRFVRSRESFVPMVYNKDNYECNMMELDENEYIGEEIGVIYYAKFNIIMLQRNRNSLSPSGIEKYFDAVLNNGTQIELVPLCKPEKMRKVEGKVKRINFNFMTENMINCNLDEDKAAIGQIIKGCIDTGAVNVSITLSMGHNKKKEMKENCVSAIQNIFKSSEKKPFSKLQVGIKESPDTDLELIDLIDYKIYDAILMKYTRENPIEYSRVINEMQDLFQKRMPLFEKVIE